MKTTSRTQTASHLFMVYPSTFGFDPQTAATNSFQRHPHTPDATVTARAQTEFDQAVTTLRRHRIGVTVFRDPSPQPKPNAVFSNNWLTTWPDGHIYLYPMATPSRRSERSAAALQQLSAAFRTAGIVDLSATEQVGQYLEGTGVIVFDHAHRLAYAAISARCHESLARQHIQGLGYEPIIFHTTGADGQPIYHTNVLMGVQSTTAVLCASAISDAAKRRQVIEALEHTGHHVVAITVAQMNQFCGNIIEVQNQAGRPHLILSQSAYDAFTPAERATLSRDKTLVPLAIPTIEAIGGGSARCMITELFLPSAA